MNEIRELTEMELEAVSGGLFDVGVNLQTIVAPADRCGSRRCRYLRPRWRRYRCERRWSTTNLGVQR